MLVGIVAAASDCTRRDRSHVAGLTSLLRTSNLSSGIRRTPRDNKWTVRPSAADAYWAAPYSRFAAAALANLSERASPDAPTDQQLAGLVIEAGRFLGAICSWASLVWLVEADMRSGAALPLMAG